MSFLVNWVEDIGGYLLGDITEGFGDALVNVMADETEQSIMGLASNEIENIAETEVSGVFENAVEQSGKQAFFNESNGLPEIFADDVLPYGSASGTSGWGRNEIQTVVTNADRDFIANSVQNEANALHPFYGTPGDLPESSFVPYNESLPFDPMEEEALVSYSSEAKVPSSFDQEPAIYTGPKQNASSDVMTRGYERIEDEFKTDAEREAARTVFQNSSVRGQELYSEEHISIMDLHNSMGDEAAMDTLESNAFREAHQAYNQGVIREGAEALGVDLEEFKSAFQTESERLAAAYEAIRNANNSGSISSIVYDNLTALADGAQQAYANVTSILQAVQSGAQTIGQAGNALYQALSYFKNANREVQAAILVAGYGGYRALND